MDSAAIEEAYQPFTSALREGVFHEPAAGGGWTAEMVAAHVVLNNDRFADAVDELLTTGSTAVDNENAVTDEVLQAHVEATGGLVELAADVSRSAGRLAAAYDELQGSGRDAEVPFRIRHEGTVIRDRPGRLGDLIEGNATYHLQMHLDQLLALRAS
jgi:hypothetical protein